MTWQACFIDTGSAKPERIYQKHVIFQQFEAWSCFAGRHLCIALIKVVPVCAIWECYGDCMHGSNDSASLHDGDLAQAFVRVCRQRWT